MILQKSNENTLEITWKVRKVELVYNKSLKHYVYTLHIQMQIQAGTGRLCCSGTKTFLNFCLWPIATRGERHNSYYADHTIWPHKRAVHPVMFKTSVGKDPKNSTLRLNGRITNSRLNGRNSTVCLRGLMSAFNWLFFKNLKFSGPSLPGMTSSTLHPHFLSGVYYDNGDCHILCARE